MCPSIQIHRIDKKFNPWFHHAIAVADRVQLSWLSSLTQSSQSSQPSQPSQLPRTLILYISTRRFKAGESFSQLSAIPYRSHGWKCLTIIFSPFEWEFSLSWYRVSPPKTTQTGSDKPRHGRHGKKRSGLSTLSNTDRLHACIVGTVKGPPHHHHHMHISPNRSIANQ